MKTIYKKLLLLLLLMPLTILAQRSVSGTVIDGSTNQPLPGVNVIVQGTTVGSSTDFDGNFTLSRVNNGDVIEFSFVGFKTKTVSFSGQSTIRVVLEEDLAQLDEVVLVSVGYGAVRRQDITGAVSTVTAKDFNQGALSTPEQLLNGRVAGVVINSGGGAPGSGSQIRIRGGSSLAASNDPLIVIDGLPLDSRSGAGVTSVLASLNPNDIESFTVLKDASATAIYGSRAANGVIIITTKRAGKELQVDYNFQYGSGRKFNQIDVFGADEFRNYVAAVRPNLVNRLGDANTNWQNEIYRRTDFVDNNLTVRGSLFGKIPTRLSIGNTYEEGLRLNNYFNRNTVALNMSPQFFENHLKIRASVNYTNVRNRFADGVEGAAIAFDPTQPVFDPSSPFGGFFEFRNGPNTSNFTPLTPNNPVAQLMQVNDRGWGDRIFGNFEADYRFHFLPDLRAVVNIGFDREDGNRRRMVGTNAMSGFIDGQTLLGTNEFSETKRVNSLLDAYFNYNKTFNKLAVDATAGYSYQRFEFEGFNTFNRNNPAAPEPRAFVDTDVVLIGLFARSIFTYNEKYILTLSLRRDGTSRFGPENRWGNFGSAAFAWNAREDLFSNSNLISDFKFRAAWGMAGQQEIAQADFFLPVFGIGDPNSQYQFGGVPFPVGVPRAFGPLRWETTHTYNAGFDFGIKDNRLTGTFDLFYNRVSDLFQTGPFPDGGNFSNAGPQNIGNMSVRGVEFQINYDVIRTDKINWNVTFNATRFERRIDKIALGIPIEFGGIGAGTGGTVLVNKEGFTPGSFFVFKQIYDAQGRPIEGAFADLNGDGIINGEDRYVFHNSDPDVILGFATNFSYKNIDIGFNLRANIGNRVFNQVNATRSFNSLLDQGPALENIPTNIFNTGFQFQNLENSLSDKFVENASFLRMDFATLGYTFPNWLGGKASLRLSTTIQNPFVITKYSGLDPEILNNGIDATIFPRQRQLLFGANVKF